MRIKRSSKALVARAVALLLSLSAITTVVTLLSLNARPICWVALERDSLPNECRSIYRMKESSLDFISNAEKLVSQIKGLTSEDESDKALTHRFRNKIMKKLETLLSHQEHRYQTSQITSFLSQPVVNFHNFSYIHNSLDVCSEGKVNVLLISPSATTNFEKRQKVRQGSRGDYVRNTTNRAKMLFFLGRPPHSENFTKIQKQLDMEIRDFRDIIQEDFEDIYSNNRLKSVSMLRWVSTHCPQTKYIIRSDDDIKINVPKLVSVLDETSEVLDNFVIGYKRINDLPARSQQSKYYMSEKEFPPAVLPPYLLGGLLGYPISTVKLLYQAALRVKPVWLEDVYITGMCAPKVYVPILSDPEFLFSHHPSDSAYTFRTKSVIYAVIFHLSFILLV